MRVLLDFRCEDGHVEELFVEASTQTAPCPNCGKLATKQISPIKTNLDPISGDFPGATMKWARQREEKIKQERKRENG